MRRRGQPVIGELENDVILTPSDGIWNMSGRKLSDVCKCIFRSERSPDKYVDNVNRLVDDVTTSKLANQVHYGKMATDIATSEAAGEITQTDVTVIHESPICITSHDVDERDVCLLSNIIGPKKKRSQNAAVGRTLLIDGKKSNELNVSSEVFQTDASNNPPVNAKTKFGVGNISKELAQSETHEHEQEYGFFIDVLRREHMEVQGTHCKNDTISSNEDKKTTNEIILNTATFHINFLETPIATDGRRSTGRRENLDGSWKREMTRSDPFRTPGGITSASYYSPENEPRNVQRQQKQKQKTSRNAEHKQTDIDNVYFQTNSLKPGGGESSSFTHTNDSLWRRGKITRTQKPNPNQSPASESNEPKLTRFSDPVVILNCSPISSCSGADTPTSSSAQLCSGPDGGGCSYGNDVLQSDSGLDLTQSDEAASPNDAGKINTSLRDKNSTWLLSFVQGAASSLPTPLYSGYGEFPDVEFFFQTDPNTSSNFSNENNNLLCDVPVDDFMIPVRSVNEFKIWINRNVRAGNIDENISALAQKDNQNIASEVAVRTCISNRRLNCNDKTKCLLEDPSEKNLNVEYKLEKHNVKTEDGSSPGICLKSICDINESVPSINIATSSPSGIQNSIFITNSRNDNIASGNTHSNIIKQKTSEKLYSVSRTISRELNESDHRYQTIPDRRDLVKPADEPQRITSKQRKNVGVRGCLKGAGSENALNLIRALPRNGGSWSREGDSLEQIGCGARPSRNSVSNGCSVKHRRRALSTEWSLVKTTTHDETTITRKSDRLTQDGEGHSGSAESMNPREIPDRVTDNSLIWCESKLSALTSYMTTQDIIECVNGWSTKTDCLEIEVTNCDEIANAKITSGFASQNVLTMHEMTTTDIITLDDINLENPHLMASFSFKPSAVASECIVRDDGISSATTVDIKTLHGVTAGGITQTVCSSPELLTSESMTFEVTIPTIDIPFADPHLDDTNVQNISFGEFKEENKISETPDVIMAVRNSDVFILDMKQTDITILDIRMTDLMVSNTTVDDKTSFTIHPLGSDSTELLESPTHQQTIPNKKTDKVKSKQLAFYEFQYVAEVTSYELQYVLDEIQPCNGKDISPEKGSSTQKELMVILSPSDTCFHSKMSGLVYKKESENKQNDIVLYENHIGQQPITDVTENIKFVGTGTDRQDLAEVYTTISNTTNERLEYTLDGDRVVKFFQNFDEKDGIDIIPLDCAKTDNEMLHWSRSLDGAPDEVTDDVTTDKTVAVIVLNPENCHIKSNSNSSQGYTAAAPDQLYDTNDKLNGRMTQTATTTTYKVTESTAGYRERLVFNLINDKQPPANGQDRSPPVAEMHSEDYGLMDCPRGNDNEEFRSTSGRALQSADVDQSAKWPTDKELWRGLATDAPTAIKVYDLYPPDRFSNVDAASSRGSFVTPEWHEIFGSKHLVLAFSPFEFEMTESSSGSADRPVVSLVVEDFPSDRLTWSTLLPNHKLMEEENLLDDDAARTSPADCLPTALNEGVSLYHAIDEEASVETFTSSTNDDGTPHDDPSTKSLTSTEICDNDVKIIIIDEATSSQSDAGFQSVGVSDKLKITRNQLLCSVDDVSRYSVTVTVYDYAELYWLYKQRRRERLQSVDQRRFPANPNSTWSWNSCRVSPPARRGDIRVIHNDEIVSCTSLEISPKIERFLVLKDI